MAEPVTVARPYAEAVFKLANESNALSTWADALANVDGVVADARVQACITDPNVSAQQLEGLVLGVVGDKLTSEARNFVQVLVANGRLDLMPLIRSQFEALKREKEGVLEAKIISALKWTTHRSDSSLRNSKPNTSAKLPPPSKPTPR